LAPFKRELNVEERDALTGLLDRRAFDAAIGEEHSNAIEAGVPLSIIFVDIDRFKAVNDGHGHQTGDQVLAEVAHRLKSCAERKGRAFRYGGEEAVIVLPNHDLNEALAVAERCRVALEREPVAGLQITASFGVSVFPDLASSKEQLIETADKAMYDAKGRGRNLVRYFGEPAPEPQEKKEVVSRKKPDSSTLTDAQRDEMRKRYFRHIANECPFDGAYLRTHEVNDIGAAATRILAHCPQCGLSVEF
jgi:diguanylate cyclase (GGDEF)-like protein